MTLTTGFLNGVITPIKASIVANWTYGAVGTGTTPASASDTALETEILRKARNSYDDSASDNVINQMFISASEGNGNTITEFGWLDAATSGNLKSRSTGFSIVKTSSIELTMETKVQIAVSGS